MTSVNQSPLLLCIASANTLLKYEPNFQLHSNTMPLHDLQEQTGDHEIVSESLDHLEEESPLIEPSEEYNRNYGISAANKSDACSIWSVSIDRTESVKDRKRRTIRPKLFDRHLDESTLPVFVYTCSCSILDDNSEMSDLDDLSDDESESISSCPNCARWSTRWQDFTEDERRGTITNWHPPRHPVRQASSRRII